MTETKYPVIKQNVYDHHLKVLFTAPRTGTVVEATYLWKKGDSSHVWAEEYFKTPDLTDNYIVDDDTRTYIKTLERKINDYETRQLDLPPVPSRMPWYPYNALFNAISAGLHPVNRNSSISISVEAFAKSLFESGYIVVKKDSTDVQVK